MRVDTAQRKLQQHEIQLPAEVQGWFILRKLRLDTTAEALVLTATCGSLKIQDIVAALKAVFPNGKGNPAKRERDVFMADESDEGGVKAAASGQEAEEAGEDVLEEMEVVADQVQCDSGYESEDALEVFETYREIRKKVQEKRINRGFRPSGPSRQAENQYQVQGSIRGKLEILKSKTRCHLCKRVGHWKRECPQRRGSSADKEAASGKGGKGGRKEAEVHLVESMLEFNEYEVLEIGSKDCERNVGSKSIHQKDNAAETVDIRKDNDAEAIHQKGNATETKDILEDNGAEAYTKKGKVADEWKVSPDGQEVWRIHRKGCRGMFDIRDAKGCPISSDRLSSSRETVVNFANGEKEVIIDEVGRGNANKDLGKSWTGITKFKVSRPGHEQAERHAVTMETFISEAEVTTFEEAVQILIAEIGSLAEHAVPDTACRKTLIGEYTLQGVEQCLRRRGLRVEWVAEENEFRFGNAGLIHAKWVVKIPLKLGSTAVMMHAAVLPEGGARTPLLLSKEVLKWLGCALDLERDTITFRKLNGEIKMQETAKGHYAIPILGDLAEHHEKSASSALRPTAVDAHTCLLSDLRQSHGQSHAFGQEADGEPGDGPRCTANGRDLGQNPRWPRRRRQRRAQRANLWDGRPGPGEIPSDGTNICRGVCDGQGLCRVVQGTHQCQECREDEEVPTLCGDERPKEEMPPPRRDQEGGQQEGADGRDAEAIDDVYETVVGPDEDRFRSRHGPTARDASSDEDETDARDVQPAGHDRSGQGADCGVEEEREEDSNGNAEDDGNEAGQGLEQLRHGRRDMGLREPPSRAAIHGEPDGMVAPGERGAEQGHVDLPGMEGIPSGKCTDGGSHGGARSGSLDVKKKSF